MAKTVGNPKGDNYRGFSFLTALWAVTKKGHEESGLKNTQFHDCLDAAVPHIEMRWEYNDTPHYHSLNRVEFLEFIGEHLFENRKK